jgi:hypothetical protein
MEAETGVHQETISRYDAERRANADKVLLRSAPPVARGQPLSYRFFVIRGSVRSPAGSGFEMQINSYHAYMGLDADVYTEE